MRYVDSSEYKKLAQNKKPPKVGIKFTSLAEPTVAGDNTRTFTFCFSDSGVDLQGDRLNAAGWDTRNFEKNPIVLFSHDATLPIGKASNLRVEDDRLLGDITFAETSLADEIFQLVRGGFVRAVSVGFMPIDYKFSNEADRAGGVDYDSMSLLEVSVCSIPCNPRALIEANEKGIHTDNLESWLINAVNNKALPATDRAVFKSLLNKDMSESDPSAGGYTGNCGRSEDDQCGMIDPDECAIHRAEDEDDETEEKTLMAMTNIVKEARAEIRRLEEQIKRLQRKSEDEMDNEEKDEDSDADVLHSKMMAHHKAAEELQDAADDHREECMKCHKALVQHYKSMESEDDEDGDEDNRPDDEEKDDEDDSIEKIKARAVAGMRR